MFLVDTILGNSLISNGPKQYNKTNILPNHSVWAKGGYSGVINDEMIVYNTNQASLKYLIEFSCD